MYCYYNKLYSGDLRKYVRTTNLTLLSLSLSLSSSSSSFYPLTVFVTFVIRFIWGLYETRKELDNGLKFIGIGGLINLELHFFFFVVKRLFITSSSYHERF